MFVREDGTSILANIKMVAHCAAQRRNSFFCGSVCVVGSEASEGLGGEAHVDLSDDDGGSNNRARTAASGGSVQVRCCTTSNYATSGGHVLSIHPLRHLCHFNLTHVARRVTHS